MEVKVELHDSVKNIEIGDIVVINVNMETYVTLASYISGRVHGEFCLVNLNGNSVWTSDTTIELLNKDVRNSDILFDSYNYTIYKKGEYELQLVKK